MEPPAERTNSSEAFRLARVQPLVTLALTTSFWSGGVCSRDYDSRMKGDRIEALVDTGQGVQTFEITATRAGRRVEVTTSRGVVEVREVTRSGQTVRTGRFMTSRLIALVEHPAADERGRVEITTRHRIQPRA